MKQPFVLVIDNYDSFVANLARYFTVSGARTALYRNDALSVEEIEALKPDALVISPGPKAPAQAGVSNAAIRQFSGRIPIFGVCLGHQCIGEVFGETVARARRPLHGRASTIEHDGRNVFKGLPSPLNVGRYHSLIVEMAERADHPLRVTARSGEGEVMGLAHETHPTIGVQFHPESILTDHGMMMVRNFLEMVR